MLEGLDPSSETRSELQWRMHSHWIHEEEAEGWGRAESAVCFSFHQLDAAAAVAVAYESKARASFNRESATHSETRSTRVRPAVQLQLLEARRWARAAERCVSMCVLVWSCG